MNDSLPLVTIAIPTYNRADSYLKLALESAINQTYPNIEIVVSDNCSTDGTETVVKSFSDPRIRYFRQPENIGPNNNFNFCVEQAKGLYFLLLQDDDLIDQDFVDTCMRAANYRTDIGIIRTGTRLIDAQGNVLKERPNRVGGLPTADFFIGWFTGKTSLYLCSTLFNARKLKEMGGFKSKHNLFQDVVAEVRLAAQFGRVDVYEVKASFRRHGSETTHSSKISYWCEDSRFLLDLMCDLVSEDQAPMVKREGRRYFSQVNYNFASRIGSPLERFVMYWTIYQTFDYRYPPLYFAYKKNLRRTWRRAKRVKYLLAGIMARGIE